MREEREPGRQLSKGEKHTTFHKVVGKEKKTQSHPIKVRRQTQSISGKKSRTVWSRKVVPVKTDKQAV